MTASEIRLYIDKGLLTVPLLSSNYKLLRTARTKTAASSSALTVETNLFDSVVIAIIYPEPCRSLERLSIYLCMSNPQGGTQVY